MWQELHWYSLSLDMGHYEFHGDTWSLFCSNQPPTRSQINHQHGKTAGPSMPHPVRTSDVTAMRLWWPDAVELWLEESDWLPGQIILEQLVPLPDMQGSVNMNVCIQFVDEYSQMFQDKKQRHLQWKYKLAQLIWRFFILLSSLNSGTTSNPAPALWLPPLAVQEYDTCPKR